MPELTIWPLLSARISGGEKSHFTHGMNQGVKIDAAIIMYLIKGARENILVDSGAGDAEWAMKYHNHRFSEYQDPAEALKKVGLRPEDIGTVICTHLHWDHCFNNDLFKKARIIVQKDEMRYAIAPLPMHAHYYESQLIKMRPPWLKAIERTEFIDGDMEIFPGINIVKIPGHTPGFHGVNVKTSKGNYFIASDFCPLFDNWQGAPQGLPPLKHIVSPIHVDLEVYHASFAKVEKIADFVLPGHDARVFEKEVYP